MVFAVIAFRSGDPVISGIYALLSAIIMVNTGACASDLWHLAAYQIFAQGLLTGFPSGARSLALVFRTHRGRRGIVLRYRDLRLPHFARRKIAVRYA